MKKDGKASYLDTGAWANKAIKEASLLGETLTLVVQKTKTTTIYPKIITFLLTQIIFTVLQTIPFMVLK